MTHRYMTPDGEFHDMPEFQDAVNKLPPKKFFRSWAGDDDIDLTLDQCLHIMSSKGVDYTIGSSDRLHNFRTVADFTGQTMEAVWGVYFYKHVSALFSYIKDPDRKTSEPIQSRVQDCIVYLLLFSKMIEERNRELEEKRKQAVLVQEQAGVVINEEAIREIAEKHFSNK